MVIIKNKTSFAKVKRLMKSINSASGSFLLWESKREKSVKEYFLKFTRFRNIISFTFLFLSTLIVTKFSLISIILCCSLGFCVFSLHVILMCYVFNKDVVKDLVKWCENIYDVEKKYHKLIKNDAEAQLMTLERQSIKLLKWLRIFFYVDYITFTFGFAIVGLFLPEYIYPKYSSPIPFYLPFKNQKTWLAFGCTTLLETIIAIDCASLTLFAFSVIFCIFMHILGFMSIIEQTAEKMKQDILTKTVGVEVPHKSFKKSTLDVKTLAEINTDSINSHCHPIQSNSVSFDEWIKIINEMICDVNSAIKSAGKLCTFPFLFIELSTLGSLFISGLMFTVIRDQYLFAIGINIISLLLFMSCYINEKILEKFENINEILYDVPWYNLTPRQRKSLMVLMHCDKIQKGLSAAKIHHLSFERFGIIVKAGYTNLLVLKDLVQK